MKKRETESTPSSSSSSPLSGPSDVSPSDSASLFSSTSESETSSDTKSESSPESSSEFSSSSLSYAIGSGGSAINGVCVGITKWPWVSFELPERERPPAACFSKDYNFESNEMKKTYIINFWRANVSFRTWASVQYQVVIAYCTFEDGVWWFARVLLFIRWCQKSNAKTKRTMKMKKVKNLENFLPRGPIFPIFFRFLLCEEGVTSIKCE